MRTRTLIITALAGLFAFAARAITSDEIAAALDVDPSIGTFSCSGAAEWYVVEGAGTNGSACVRSGAIGDSQTSTLMLTVNPVRMPCRCTVRFWKKVSSEGTCDVLVVSGNRYGNNETWEQVSVSQIIVPGQTPDLSFSYSKDHSVSSGSDCVWIDGLEIIFTPIIPESPSVAVTDITCTQRTPWNGMVDIDYTVTCDKADEDIWVYPVGYDKDTNTTMAPRTLTGEGVDAPVKAGTHRMTWNVTTDYPGFNSTAFTVKMTALIGAAPYMVVDLSGGVDAQSYPVSYLSSVPEGGWGDEYRTTKMAFRLIPPGSFWMGSPSDETSRCSYEDLHGVVITKPFYMGVFECTQKQYQLVMGTTPANYKGDMRPVEQMSYNNLRGSVNGAAWPTHNQVDADSFMGRLRSKANMLFDLPTEAEWEYACRAGTSSALNSGKPYTEQNVKEVARSGFNNNDGKGGYSQHTKVGCYLANNWGLYDMHGNVYELCRDYWNGGLGNASVVDPKGATSGTRGAGRCRACRGDYWGGKVGQRSAFRDTVYLDYGSSTWDYVGFRVYCSPVAE